MVAGLHTVFADMDAKGRFRRNIWRGIHFIIFSIRERTGTCRNGSIEYFSFANQVKWNNLCTFIVTAFFKQMDIIHDFLHPFFIQIPEWIDLVLSNEFSIYIINIQYFTNSKQLSGTGLCDSGFSGTDGVLFYMDIVIFKFFCKPTLVQSVRFSMFGYGLSQIIHNRLPF